jgi:hypothetical protein
MVGEEASDHLLEPGSLLGDWFIHARRAFPLAPALGSIILGLIAVALNTSVDLIVTYWAAKARAGLAK